MGNSSSHNTQPQGGPQHAQWANSYPRALTRVAPQHKVLPERIPGQRLRMTDNGVILQSGGTISGRRQTISVAPRNNEQANKQMYRIRSSSVHQSRQMGPSNEVQSINDKRFGSEPDLRFPSRDHSYNDNSPSKLRISRSRKKYKAPAPPPEGDSPGLDSSSPDSYQWDQPARRIRLFKTRAETKKTLAQSSPAPKNKPSQYIHCPSPTIQRSLSSPQFQAELIQAAQRLRPVSREENERRELTREDGSGRESTPEPIPRRPTSAPVTKAPARKEQEKHWEILPPISHKKTPSDDKDLPKKTFYFGMDQYEREVVDRFAARLRQGPPVSGESFSSEPEDDDDDDAGGIALALRPTLPKKQLEIPRFSPTAAWRLLSALDSPPQTINHTISTYVEECPVVLQERPVAPRSSLDKSGDSGISGDASPGGQDAWTPQQDLEEESSSDGGVETSRRTPIGHHTFSPRANVFSLSLPRDDRLCLALYPQSSPEDVSLKSKIRRDSQPSFNSLKKLKRSVSGAFGRKDLDKDAEPLNENWVLSRSMPSSLNTGHELVPWDKDPSSSSNPSSPERPSFSYLTGRGHVMYLPQYELQNGKHTPPPVREHNHNIIMASRGLSKSCENISAQEMREIRRTPSPTIMNRHNMSGSNTEDRRINGKGKRFTFQSTVRQIERRRLAERLSREAELKEKKRLSELEAMRRVEEEFQRKRAKEKANIRQQLRLFSLDENQHVSLPSGWGDARDEPDGAPSPSPPTHQATQVLSEFRESRREYRDYRQSRYGDSGPECVVQIDSRKATIHPEVVYDMPKSTQVYVTPRTVMEANNGTSTPRSSSSDNYRRDFAHGARPTGRSVASSDSEMSAHAQPRHGRHSNHIRARSASPDSSSEHEEQPIIKVEKSHQIEMDDEKPVPQPRVSLTTLQPFARDRNKSYRPIAFNPGPTTPQKFAQIVN